MTPNVRYLVRILFLMVALGGSLFPIAASAATSGSISCGSAVFSDGGLLDSQQSAIQSTVSSMQSKSALVRVLGLQSMGGASSLDSFVNSYTSRCGYGSGTGLRSSMIVLAVSVAERKTTIHFGRGWSPSLSSRYLGIESDMNGQFRSGNYAGGMAQGLREVNSYMSSRPATVTNAQAQQAVGSGNSDSGKIVAIIILSIVGVVSALLLIFFGIPYIVNRRRETQARRDDRGEAQTKARIVKGQANSAVVALGSDVNELELRVEALPVGQVPSETITRFRATLDAIKTDYSLAQTTLADCDTNSADPSTAGLSAGQYRAIERAYREVIDRVDDVRRQLGGLRATLDALKRGPNADVFQRPDPTPAVPAAVQPTRREAAPTSGSAGRVSGSSFAPDPPIVSSASNGNRPSFGYVPDGVGDRVADAIRRTEVDLRNAWSYFRTFGNYISERAWRHLNNARNQLDRARSDRGVRDSTRSRHLRDARNELERAMAIAKDDVRYERDYSSYGYYDRYGSSWFPMLPVIVPVPFGEPFYNVVVPYYGYDGMEREVRHDEWQTTFEQDQQGGGSQSDWDQRSAVVPTGEETGWDSTDLGSGNQQVGWDSSGDQQSDPPEEEETSYDSGQQFGEEQGFDTPESSGSGSGWDSGGGSDGGSSSDS